MSNDLTNLDDAPAPKKAKHEVQSSEPQFNSGTETANALPDIPVRRTLDMKKVMKRRDIVTLRMFLQSAQSTPQRRVQLLHAAVDDGWLEGFDALVESNAMNESRQADTTSARAGHFTLFEKAISSLNGKMLDRLDDLDRPMHQRSRNELKNAIVIASYTGNPDILQRLCRAADVERVQWLSSELSLFFKAAVAGTKVKSGDFAPGAAAIAYLLAKYPDRVVRSTYDDSLLEAVGLCNWEAASILLGLYGADPEARDAENQTPLMQAAKSGRFDVYELLRFHDASPHTQDSTGKSVLHHAVEAGNERIISDLVSTCAVNTDVKDFLGQTASGYAAMVGKDRIENLIDCGACSSFDRTDF